MRLHGRLLSAFYFGLCFLPALQTLGHARVLDAFEDRSDAAARARWVAGGSAPPVSARGGNGLVFDCPFGRLSDDRFYWDRDLTLDLSGYAGLELELACDRPEAMRSMAVYLRSGDGWYIWSRPLPRGGRQQLFLSRTDFEVEGTPDGWEHIDRVRISPWRGSRPADTSLHIYRLSAMNPPVLLLRGNLSVPNPGERVAAYRATRVLSRRLTALGVPHAVVDESDLTPKHLASARVLVLGYNPVLPDTLHRKVTAFLDQGGKALVFYSADARLARRLGFELDEYQAARTPMQWSAFSFTDPAGWRVPPRVLQDSWNLRPVRPVRPDAAIIAWWENAVGQRSSEPAWGASRDGAWMTHILLDGDNLTKENLLAGLLTRWVPELWPAIVTEVVEQSFRMGRYTSMREARIDLEKRVRGLTPALRNRVTDRLALAVQSYELARRAQSEGRHIDAFSMARACRRLLTESLALSMPAVGGEFRGVWDHHALGWYPGDWDRTARELREAGFGVVFPNVAWAGLAHYPSPTLPGSVTLERLGDQLAAAIRAARDNGMELHAWIVCWNLGGAPADFVERLRGEGRLQRDADGAEVRWLCPAHPDNRRHMLRVVEEIAAYRPHGIHLDYIRFPGASSCFCDTCRRQVADRLGSAITDLREAVRSGGPAAAAWEAHRVAVINDFVEAAHQAVKRVDPKMALSAAVFGGYPGTIRSIAQDWGAWLRDDRLDFVVPMNYTADTATFVRWTRDQRQGPAAGARLIPGIGFSSSEAPLTADQVLDQIDAVRRLGVPGYVLFALDLEMREQLLPILRMGNRP